MGVFERQGRINKAANRKGQVRPQKQQKSAGGIFNPPALFRCKKRE